MINTRTRHSAFAAFAAVALLGALGAGGAATADASPAPVERPVSKERAQALSPQRLCPVDDLNVAESSTRVVGTRWIYPRESVTVSANGTTGPASGSPAPTVPTGGPARAPEGATRCPAQQPTGSSDGWAVIPGDTSGRDRHVLANTSSTLMKKVDLRGQRRASGQRQRCFRTSPLTLHQRLTPHTSTKPSDYAQAPPTGLDRCQWPTAVARRSGVEHRPGAAPTADRRSQLGAFRMHSSSSLLHPGVTMKHSRSQAEHHHRPTSPTTEGPGASRATALARASASHLVAEAAMVEAALFAKPNPTPAT